MRTPHGYLWQGDCLDLMGRIPAGRIGMVFADLPYGTTACRWDVVLPFERLWPDWARVGAPGVAVVLTATQPFTAVAVMSQIKWFKHEWVWDKCYPVGFQIAKHRPMQRHETVLVFAIGGGRAIYNPIKQPQIRRTGGAYKGRLKSDVCPIAKEDNKPREYTDLYPQSIIAVSNADHTNVLHPTQKPVGLLQYLIKTYSNPGDVILDPTAGSGTTAIAAMNTGRRFVCIEKDPEHYATMVMRVMGHMRKQRNSLGILDR